MPVTYTAPSLPSWLSWKEDVLSGIPPPDAQNCDVTVEARVGLTMFAAHHVVSDESLHHQFIQRRHGVVVLGREFFYYTIALFFSVRVDGWMDDLVTYHKVSSRKFSYHIIYHLSPK